MDEGETKVGVRDLLLDRLPALELNIFPPILEAMRKMEQEMDFR